MYKIRTNRKTALLYLSWEYGIARAVKWASENPKFGFYVLKTEKRKRDAENFARHISLAQAFQSGRIGYPLSDGSVFIEKGE